MNLLSGSFMAGFKFAATKSINKYCDTPGIPVWQRNYFDLVIQNEIELNHIRKYIINNPLEWEFDNENPKRR